MKKNIIIFWKRNKSKIVNIANLLIIIVMIADHLIFNDIAHTFILLACSFFINKK